MRATRVTQTGAGSSAPIIPNKQLPASVAAVVTGLVASYDVEVAFDNLFDTSITPTWYNIDDTSLVAASASAYGKIDYPVTGVRVTINTGTGAVALTLVQDERPR